MMRGVTGEIFMKETVGTTTKDIMETITKNIMKIMVITADRNIESHDGSREDGTDPNRSPGIP